MKAKKIFLFVTCIVLCILFVACSNESTPQADNPQMENPAESKSFAQEKIEEAGFKVAKVDNTLPTMEDVPEELQKLANDPYSLSANLASLGVISWDCEYEVAEALEAHAELCPQITIAVNEIFTKAGGEIGRADKSSIQELSEFGKEHGLWD